MFKILTSKKTSSLRTLCELPANLHRDESGALSILTVFMMFVFTILLMMIVNIASHTDDKLRMQNAADAAAYSGGVVLARGMNAIAFSNHLLADVLGVTAFLREERDKNNASATYALPIFEHILKEELISQFQQSVVENIPNLAQQTTDEVAWRHGLTAKNIQNLEIGSSLLPSKRSKQLGALWKSNAILVGQPDEADPLQRSLPVIDPSPLHEDFNTIPNANLYLERAIEERKMWATYYWERWTWKKAQKFGQNANLLQVGDSNDSTTSENYLEEILDEYPKSNLPMLLRGTETGISLSEIYEQGNVTATNQHLEKNYQFVSAVYRKHIDERAPGVFKNKLKPHSDAMTFAQVTLFAPAPRYRERPHQTNTNSNQQTSEWISEGDPKIGWPIDWDSWNQNWSIQLAPATLSTLPKVLGASPGKSVTPTNLGDLTIHDLKQINTH